MSTNYYLKDSRDLSRERHIGKSSGGWCFALRVYPDEDINSLSDWKNLILNCDESHLFIENEYGESVSPADMLEVIENRSWDRRPQDAYRRSASLTTRYKSFQDYLDKNQADLGPNNLLRHRITPGHCVAQGEGTWDCLIGDFS